MKVISTDAGASLPAKEGRAEILNSSLVNYSEVTLCARFLTYHFSAQPTRRPYQSLISYGRNVLLSSYLAKSCDDFYEGCTEIYREKIAGHRQQWTEGKVFGNLQLLGKAWNEYFYYPWWPGVWNTACITVKASEQHSRVNININGQTVFQTEDIADVFFKSFKARI